MIVNKYTKKIHEKYPDFTVALGNEIYLIDERKTGLRKYYHFILIAKDRIGYRGITELSSIAWLNSYVDRRMERVPLLKSELKDVMTKFKGHIIGTTACIGSELGQTILNLETSEKTKDQEGIIQYHNQIVDYMKFCIDVFGKDNFYIECAPATSKDQITVNKRLLRIAESFGVNMCVATDAHYPTKADRFIHKAYLNSKNGEREVDDFYEFTYLMDESETRKL